MKPLFYHIYGLDFNLNFVKSADLAALNNPGS